MSRNNYIAYTVVCEACGTLNRYELPVVDTRIEGRPRPIWANDRKLQQGARSFPCRACRQLIPIAS
jgi:RNase P subunit RPR2